MSVGTGFRKRRASGEWVRAIMKRNERKEKERIEIKRLPHHLIDGPYDLLINHCRQKRSSWGISAGAPLKL